MVQIRDFQSRKKYRHSLVCIYRLCRFFIVSNNWRCEFAYAVPYDFDTLRLVPVNALRLMHIDFLNELPDDLGGQFFDVRVLPYKGQEAVNIHGAFLFGSDQLFQLGYPSFQTFLFFLIAGAHLCKTLIGNLTFNIVFIEPLNNLVQLADTGLCLFQLTLTVPEVAVKIELRFFRNQFNEICLVFPCINCAFIKSL